mmetsp:Transcript_6176/g.15098  ORF Transcript_6176/g.15098 Transcript_6176/m.15098 type:complete len:926 (-) Transcript_6176:161-2938(-)
MTDIISYDHCINQLPDEYNVDGTSTPPMCIGTPSEPGSPRQGTMGPGTSFRDEAHMQNMQNMQWIPAMGSWDCAADFVPGCAVMGCNGEFIAGSDQGMGVWAMQQIVDHTTGCTQWIVPMSGNADCSGLGGPCGGGEEFDHDCNYIACDGSVGLVGCMDVDGMQGCIEEVVDPSQMGEQYTWDVQRNEEEELGVMQKRMCDLEHHRSQMQRSWEREREGLVRELERYREVLQRYAIPLEEACDRALPPSFPKKSSTESEIKSSGKKSKADRESRGADVASSLDAKMKRLNGLLLEDPPRRRGKDDGFGNADDEPMPTPGGATESTASPDESNSNPDGEESTGGVSKIASTLQALFPNAKVHTRADAEGDLDASFETKDFKSRHDRFGSKIQEYRRKVGAMADSEVDDLATKLETNTRSAIDDRALHALQALPASLALEALQKVDDLIESQGGSCRNLSSILQSVCRKVERKGGRGEILPRDKVFAKDDQSSNPAVSMLSHSVTEEVRKTRPLAFKNFDDVDKAPARSPKLQGGADSEGSTSDNSTQAQTDRVPVERIGARAARLRKNEDDSEGSTDGFGDEGPTPRWADIGLDEEVSPDSIGEYWTHRRVEKEAAKGFELKKNEADQWQLRLNMSALEPPFNESAMDLYCTWLRSKLSEFRNKHGQDSFQNCNGEIDFSNNNLGDKGVWTLLETLVQNEVQAAVLKLYKNQISDGGVLAICEFIGSNQSTGPVYEMHLSHNNIDDDSALDLLVALQRQSSKYPPRRGPNNSDKGRKESNNDNSQEEDKPVPVWVRLNQNQVKNPGDVLKSLEQEGVTFCRAHSAADCGPTKCKMQDCPLLHLYLFTDQAATGQQGAKNQANEAENAGQNGGIDGRPGRKRNGRQKYRAKGGQGDTVHNVDGEFCGAVANGKVVEKKPQEVALKHQ